MGGATLPSGLGEGDQLAQGGIEGVLGGLVAEPVQAGVGDVRPVDQVSRIGSTFTKNSDSEAA